jgi:hypothetical protein
VPSTLPSCDNDDESIGQPDMCFSIATYTVPVNKDSTYEKKLVRLVLPRNRPKCRSNHWLVNLFKFQTSTVIKLISCVVLLVSEKKVDDPLPLVA